MIKYVAFLRGINVGGRNLIRMADLAVMFDSAGLSGVRTYIQSGNVIFESAESDQELLRSNIEHEIEHCTGKKITVILRTMEEIMNILLLDPFQDHKWGNNTKLYVCFLDKRPEMSVSLPLHNQKEALILTHIIDRDAFLVSLPKDDEHFGFPNPFIEKELKVLSTARNWNTIIKIAEL